MEGISGAAGGLLMVRSRNVADVWSGAVCDFDV